MSGPLKTYSILGVIVVLASIWGAVFSYQNNQIIKEANQKMADSALSEATPSTTATPTPIAPTGEVNDLLNALHQETIYDAASPEESDNTLITADEDSHTADDQVFNISENEI